MNYTINEETTNFAQIAGVISKELAFSHQVEGENFYEFSVEVERLSKIKDEIPVTVSERCLQNVQLKVGDFVKVCGEYRSYNKFLQERSKLILHLFAKDLQKCQEHGEHINEVRLTGFVCKQPIYRKTPFNREICDVLLAVNRTNYHKSDYVPCIMWGRNARFVASQNIGCKIELSGRIQSREYVKSTSENESEVKTAYEVSCQRISILANVTHLAIEQEDKVANR